MKKYLAFDVDGIKTLADELRAGLVGYAVEGTNAGRKRSLFFLLRNSSVLRVQVTVTPVDSWHEVGSLVFRHLSKDDEPLVEMVQLDQAWSKIQLVEKLVLEDDTFCAECGLAVVNQAGQELIIVAGAFPHTVELLAPFYACDFQPEYELEAYRRVAY